MKFLCILFGHKWTRYNWPATNFEMESCERCSKVVLVDAP